MPRRIKHRINLTEIYSEINEVFTEKIPTDYKLVDYGNYLSYEFKTNSGTLYDLEFHYSEEFSFTKLDNNKILGEILNTDKKIIECFDIAFTLSSVINKNNPDEFELDSNKKEIIELMGRMVYILNHLIEQHSNYNLFIVGNSRRNRMKIYELIFKNHFKNKFDLYRGKSQHHNGESFFIIKK